MLNVLLWFDTEDYITPESDEAVLGLLNLLRDRGIRGIFKIVGEKARVLKARHRHDILSMLCDHEIGYHTNFHSVRPTVSEYLEPFSFREGVEAFERRERDGFIDVERITGMRAACFGQPGYSWAPQTFPALKHWGIDVYLDVHDVVSLGGKPFWYGGMLNLTKLTGTMRMELEDAGLDEAKSEFDRLCDELPSDNRFLSIYYHPCEFSTTEFWDGVNFANGANPPREQWQPARLRKAGEMDHYLHQLGNFLDYTLAKDDVRYIVPSELIELEQSVRDPLPYDAVKAMARQIKDQVSFQIIDGRSMSAADIFRCFYHALTGEAFPSEILYGPNRIEDTNIHSLTVAQLIQALQVDYPTIFGFRQLPNAFRVDGHQIHPVDMLCTMAKVIADGLSKDDEVPIVKGELASAAFVRDDDAWGSRWIIFPHDLRVPNIVQNAKLQAWTLKPALFS